MYDVDELIEEVKSSALKTKDFNRTVSLTSELIDEHKLRESLFTYIKNSTEDDLVKIKELIVSNPRRYAVSQTSPDSFINKLHQNTRPLYEAARFGYVETVKLLIKYGADPHLRGGDGISESCLDVACRWRHQHVVEVLLEKSSWTPKELKIAMKHTSKQIEEMLDARIAAQDRKNCKCLIY
jgi:hypothetical protein